MKQIHISTRTSAPMIAFLLCLCMLVLWPSSRLRANAQNPPAGNAHLDSVLITGSQRFNSVQIASAIGLRAGQEINRDALQNAADKLAELGLFQNIQYRFSTIATGVKVTYEVADAPLLPVTFDNFPWVSDDDLSAGLKASGILFNGSAPAKGAILDAMSDALIRTLDQRGVHAHVTHQVISMPVEGQMVQQFRVDDADLTVQSIEFNDPLAKNDRAIQAALADLVGKPYSRSRIELFEFEQLRPIYLAHSYLQVRFGATVAEFASKSPNVLSGPLVITAPIIVGPAYQWGGVQWQGNSSIGSPNLDQLVDLQPGSPADGNKIEATWERVRAAYGQAGYLDATLDPQPQFDAKAARVIYTVTIKEGPQYHMGNLVLTGLSMEGERRIRAGFPIASDAIFNKDMYERFLSSGIKTAFAGLPVHYDKIGRFLQEDQTNAKVDVMLDFQ
ncbi:MAG: POTRA domain-containing protein [Candidatus Acidiferrales bacterium]